MSKRLFVGGLPYNTTEEELKGIFEKIGPINSCSIITDKFTNQSKGFAFVEMTNDADGDIAIEKVNNTELGGRKIMVSVAKPREERGSSFGGNRSYGNSDRNFSRDRDRGSKRY